MHSVGVGIPKRDDRYKIWKKFLHLGYVLYNIYTGKSCPSVMRIWTPCSWLLLLRPYVPSIGLSTLCFPV